MHKILFLILVYFGIQFSGASQTTYGVAPPDTIRTKCDNVIISEIGKTAFENNVRFIKCDLQKTTTNNKETGYSYTLYYSFFFANVKESHVIFSLDYKFNAKQRGVIKDGAFKNFTRLPESIKILGAKIISYNDAKKIAVAADTVLKRYQSKLYGEISTEYDEKKKEYEFVWLFYYMDQCKGCKTEMYTTYSVFVNAANGKVISVTNNKN